MPEPPVVTVLMATFNDAAFLPEAARSILAQTFAEFEFLIIDDASTDETSRYLGNVQDPRVRVIRNDSNQGLTRSLKRGIELARGSFIARLDADDVALPGRLEQQIHFMEKHPEVAILGGACLLVDEAGKPFAIQRQPENDLTIRWTSLLTNPFVHSTVMLRRHALREHGLNYNEAFDTSQDYDLWTRLLRHGKGANLSTPLIRYRVRPGITRKRRERQIEHAKFIAARTIRDELPGSGLQPEQVSGLLDWLFPESWSQKKARPRVISLVKLQCQLHSEFAAKYASHPDLPVLRRRHFAQMIRVLRNAGLSPDWGKAWIFVLRKEPLAPVWAALDLLRSLGGRISFLRSRQTLKTGCS